MRTVVGGMDDWGGLDLSAALAEGKKAFPTLPLHLVAHSVGSLLVGAAEGADCLSKMVFFGPHTGYWRDYGSRWRWILYLIWHVLMPAATRTFGYFPGRLLHLGEDLPRQAALDWAARKQPQLVRTKLQQQRFGPLLSRFGKVRAQTLAMSITDDAFAPPEAGRRLLQLYPNLSLVEHEAITPRSVDAPRLGHFGFFRRPYCFFFWSRALEWLLPSVTSVSLPLTASRHTFLAR